MRFATLPALARRSIPLFATLACAACAGAPPIAAIPSACSTLVPDAWKQGVAGAPLPVAAVTIGEWVAFGDAQTAQLDKANGRTADAISIIERCEQRDAAAVKKVARHRVLGIL